MKKNIISFSLLLFGMGSIQAQNDVDAIRFANTIPGGTARNIGAGSIMGAIGGDMGGISSNPASLGLFRRSEFSLSPSMAFMKTKTNFFKKNPTFQNLLKIIYEF